MLDSLRHFLLVVEHGTFTEASRRAHLTQPSLSASIKRLEEGLGCRVLDRGPAGARPNAAGHALIPHARHALAAVDDGRRAVAEVAGLARGVVRLGVGPTAATYLLPATFAAFRAEAPGIRFFLKEAHSPAVWDALQRGELDLGLVSDTTVPLRHTWFEAEPCIDDELIVVRGAAPVDSLAFVSFPQGSSLRGLLDQHFPEADVVMELASIAAVKGNVRAGIGRCLISRAAVIRDLEEGTLVRVEDPRTPISRTLTLIHRGAHRLPPAAVRLRELLLTLRSPKVQPVG
jgi:DNA-binding transcriptional LysR family regulator